MSENLFFAPRHRRTARVATPVPAPRRRASVHRAGVHRARARIERADMRVGVDAARERANERSSLLARTVHGVEIARGTGGDGDGRRARGATRWRTMGAIIAIVSALVSVGAVMRARGDALGFLNDSAFHHASWWRGHRGKGSLQPHPPVEGETRVVRSFTMYYHCMSKDVKEWAYEKDFWNFARQSGKVVRHNYGSGSFFDYKKAIVMSRQEISDGLYAWQVNASGTDWEFGFALENAKGEYLYEIGQGPGRGVPLSYTACSQRYGKFFNRNIQLERDKAHISYVFGSCDAQCPGDYIDTSYENQPLSGVIRADGTPLDLSEQRDARLVKPLTIMMYSETNDRSELTGLNPHLRVALQMDTSFPATKKSVRWIAGGVDYFRKFVKMVKVEIYINNDGATPRAFIKIVGAKRYRFVFTGGYAYEEKEGTDWRIFGKGSKRTYNGCTKVFCDPSRYDLTRFWSEAEANMTGLALRQLQYKNLVVGDSAPVDYGVSSAIDGIGAKTLLTWAAAANTNGGHLLAAAGKWGTDLDVRRVIVKAGAICSKSTNMGNCMYGIAQSFNTGDAQSYHSRDWNLGPYTGPTKYRKQWILASLVGYGWKMVRIEIYQQNGALYAVTIDCANDHSQEASEYTAVTGDGLLNDLSHRYRNPSDAWKDKGAYPTGLAAYKDWDSDARQVINIGGLYYDLAGDMRPSLTGYEQIYSTLELENALSGDSDDPANAPPTSAK